jgi:RNA polymerase sigma-32 factor
MKKSSYENRKSKRRHCKKMYYPKNNQFADSEVDNFSVNLPDSPDAMSIYMRQMSGFPVISAKKQCDLARRFQDQGDQEAAYILISSNLRLVVKIAMKFRRQWMDSNLDLIQEGNMGLMQAVKKFDPDRGIKFSYYASFWIKAYILKFIMSNWRMVKIGTSHAQRNLFYNLGREKQRLEALGVKPDPDTISRNLDVSEADVVEMGQRLGQHDLSLDMPLNSDSDITPGDVIPADGDETEEIFLKKETSEIIRKKLHELLPVISRRERDIINLRLLADTPLTLGKIGEKYDITRERVRQIESKLLGKIKNYIQKDLSDFSGEWIQGP